MILVRLLGGLGNQMFQYAAGRSLADRLGAELVLDPTLLSGAIPGITPRTYALSPFSLRARTATAQEVVRYQLGDMRWRAVLKKRLIGRHAGLRWVRYFGRRFNPRILNLPDNTCLAGNFQSERYFASIASELRADLSFREPVGSTDAAVLEMIGAQKNSVSVHIRRGDYAANPQVRQVHGLLPVAYYERCADYVAAEHVGAHFFVFSDDPEWAKANLHLRHPHSYVARQVDVGAHHDLRLMTQCCHHIIANSSFSWWGAWLAQGRDKAVLCPLQWFADSRQQGDVVPEGWLKVDAKSTKQ